MILENGHIDTVSNQKTVEFGLDNSSGHLFSVLSQLYSNPVESTIRELCTNCTDAHIMSNNQSKPFIIKLPNYEKNIYHFSIRDFGPGLTHDEVMSIYKWYGRSTKTSSNDVTGCLGLGSKSPYSISSTFYVKSYNNGKCSQYTCTMDNIGKPNISELPIVYESSEENGLEVTIPFYKEVNFDEILPRILKYFKVKPLVYRQMGELEQDVKVNITWKTNNEMFKLTDTIWVDKRHSSGIKLLEETREYNKNEVVQLQIYYPLDIPLITSTIERFNKLYINEKNETIEKFQISETRKAIILKLLHSGIQIHSEPGRIAFAPSRESIKYTDLTLIYIVKELNKAAKLYEKQYESMFNNIDDYEKAFRAIYLGKSKYSLVKKAGFLKHNPLISAYEEIFKFKQTGDKLNNFYHFRNVGVKNWALMEYGSILYSPEENFSLDNNKSLLNPLFEWSNNLRYYDAMSVDGFELSDNGNTKVMITSFATQFTKDLLRLCLNKLIYNTYISLKKSIKEDIERIYNLSDKEFIEYTKESSYDKYSFLSIKQDINLEPLVDNKRFNLEEAYSIIDNLHFDETLRMVSRFYGKLNYFNSNVKYNTDKFVKQLFIYMSLSASDMRNRVSTLKSLNVPDSELLDTINTLNPFRYKEFELRWATTYRKFVKVYLKNKKNTLSKLTYFNFDNIPYLLLGYTGDTYSSNMGNCPTILPFNDVLKLKNKETLNILDLICQYILTVYVKFYEKEFESQIEYSKSNKDEMVTNILKGLNIPLEYAVKVKGAARSYPSPRNYSSVKKATNKFNFDLVQPGLDCSNVKTNVFKFEKVPDIESIKELKSIMIDSIKDIHSLLKEMVSIYNYHKLFVNEFNDFKNNISLIQSYNKVFEENIELKYHIVINKIKKYLTYIDRPFKNVVDEYNTYIMVIRRLNSLRSDICNTDGVYEVYQAHNINKKELRNTLYLNHTVTNIYGIEYNGFYERSEEEVEDEIYLVNKKYYFQYNDEKFIFTKSFSGNFEFSQEKAEEYYEEYFNDYKFILVDDLIKIGIGRNYFPEKYDLKFLSKYASDGSTKKARKVFTDRYTNELKKLINYVYPDFIIVDSLKIIPEKYQKLVYNFIPFILELPFTEAFKKLNGLNNNYNKLIEIDSDNPFIPNLKSKSILHKNKIVDTNGEIIRDIDLTNILRYKTVVDSKGIASKSLYEDQLKFLSLFADKDIILNYKNIYKDLWKSLYETIITFLEIKDPNALKKLRSIPYNKFIENKDEFNSVLNINSLSSDIKDIFRIFSHLIDFRNSLINIIKNNNSEETELTKIGFVVDKSKPFNANLMNFLKKEVAYMYGRVIDGYQMNITEVQRIFDEFITPEVKEKKVMIKSTGIDDFYNKVKLQRSKNLIHHKVNKRTKEKEQLRKVAKQSSDVILSTLRFVSKIQNQEVS